MSARNIVVAREPEPSTPPLRSAAPAGEAQSSRQPRPAPDRAPEAQPNTGATDEPGRDLKALGREALNSAEQTVPEVAEVPAPAPRPGASADADHQDDTQFDLGRVAWLATVLSCLLAVVILALDGYAGYAGVTAAVALAAAINLF